jgi:hypothetical protein
MNEIDAVKELGDKIGYGNMMDIASALWRRLLKKSGAPTEGAFIPTSRSFIKEDAELQKITHNEIKRSNYRIKEHFKD